MIYLYIYAYLVLYCPDVLGLKTTDLTRAKSISEYLGCSVMVCDFYGEEALPRVQRDNMKGIEKAFDLMNNLLADKETLRNKLKAAIQKGSSFYGAKRVTAIGFCFGGSCVLEMVRGGLGVNGVVSFHGGLSAQPGSGAKGQPPPALKSNPKNTYNVDCDVLGG